MRQCRQIYAQGNILVRKFSMCSNAVKITLFRTYCSSLYTSQLWWNYSKTAIKKMYVAYNNAFRMLFRLPRDCSASGMFAQNGVLCCPAVIRNLSFRFRGRLNTSSNMCVRMYVLNSDMRWHSRIRLHWRRLLFVYLEENA